MHTSSLRVFGVVDQLEKEWVRKGLSEETIFWKIPKAMGHMMRRCGEMDILGTESNVH